MASHTPASVMQSFYAAERKFMISQAPKDQQEMLSYFSKTAVLHQSPSLPWGGDFHGIQGVQSWAKQMSDLFDTVDVQNPEFFEKANSDEVVIKSTLKLRLRKTGTERQYPFVQIVRVDIERGLITEIKPMHWDIPDILELVKQ